MLQKLSLYINTVRYMKPSQVYYRLRKILHVPCTLGVTPKRGAGAVTALQTLPELDFDPVFLARFPAEEIMADKITLLHETETFHWDTRWYFPARTPLWNYNLHYFEYAFPLVKAYKDTAGRRYLDKLKKMISAWIAQNPKAQGGAGWDPYPLALRLTNWLAIYTHLEQEFTADAAFCRALLASMYEQFDCLAHHLEKDLLGNHYFEDLKALVLCSLFFGDAAMLQKVLAAFRQQCREQILPDGMHFELSPMYHNIALEDMLRVAAALRGAGRPDSVIEGYLQPMLDAAWSLEEGLERLPLFNDCGNNVAKSLDALCSAAESHFGLTAVYKAQLPASGYYIFKQGDWKLIVDAGQPGPAYIPGHAHCDAMSFELFKAGKPVLVNCGTYAYQCKERTFFRSTAAHNTVQVAGVEQSQCWGAFRVAKRSRVRVMVRSDSGITIRMRDQSGHVIERRICLAGECLQVEDRCRGSKLKSYLHFACPVKVQSSAVQNSTKTVYAPEFGRKMEILCAELTANDTLQYQVSPLSGNTEQKGNQV